MFKISEYLKNLWISKGFELSEWQKATFIWNSPDKTWNERISCLKKLTESFSDKRLCMQIEERVTYEENMLSRFKKNDGKFVYVVIEGDCPIGYFAKYDMAEAYAVKNIIKDKIRIEKQRIVSDETELKVKRTDRFNPHLFDEPLEEYEEYYGAAASCISLNTAREILSIWSNEMSDEETAIIDDFNSERFELQYSKIPFEAKAGTIVKIMSDPNKYEYYGILLTDTKEWNKFLEMSVYKDFSDITVTVVYLTKQGLWSHQHINPCYLDFNVLPPFDLEDKRAMAYNAALMALSEYYLSDDRDFNTSLALLTAKDYRDICIEHDAELERNKCRIHNCAKKVEDTMKKDLQYYCLELDDYATPSFCTFSKPYFGTLEQIASLINKLDNEYYRENHSRLINAFKKYLAGNTAVTHNVAYSDVPLLTPVSVYDEISFESKSEAIYTHHNIWDWICAFRWKGRKSRNIWLKYNESFFRCAWFEFTKLELMNLEGVFKPLEYTYGGFPEIIEIKENSVSNRLAVIEKVFKKEAELLYDIKKFKEEPDFNFEEFFNDIFGDS